jgi:hypothetical protein
MAIPSAFDCVPLNYMPTGLARLTFPGISWAYPRRVLERRPAFMVIGQWMPPERSNTSISAIHRLRLDKPFLMNDKKGSPTPT